MKNTLMALCLVASLATQDTKKERAPLSSSTPEHQKFCKHRWALRGIPIGVPVAKYHPLVEDGDTTDDGGWIYILKTDAPEPSISKTSVVSDKAGLVTKVFATFGNKSTWPTIVEMLDLTYGPSAKIIKRKVGDLWIDTKFDRLWVDVEAKRMASLSEGVYKGERVLALVISEYDLAADTDKSLDKQNKEGK